jgi:hypothetical protein
MHVVAMGNDTYTITREGVTAFTRSASTLKAEVREDAAEFCASKGKQMKVLEITEEKPNRTTNAAHARIVFKAVDPGDPSLTGNPAAGNESPTGVGLLYTDLVKLDDLHKKNILTDEEFKGEKKKVLDHSK